MKWTTILALLVVVAMVAEARLTPEERAQRRAEKQAAKAERRAKKHNKHDKGCIYHWRQATCDEASGKKVAQLNVEKSTGTDCPATKESKRIKNCKEMAGNRGNRRPDCKYSHEGATCDPTTMVLTKQLMADQPADCPAIKTKTVKQCPDAEKLARRADKKGKGCGCKYSKRGTCDPDTLIVSRPLKRCSPNTCDPVMTETVTECPTRRQRGERGGGRRRECKYKHGTWSECDPVSNKKMMVKTLKRGDPASCNETMTVEQECKRKPKRNVVCKYRRTQWSECDPVSNKKSMVQTLKRGSSDCQPTQTIQKLCKRKKRERKKKKVCKYRRTQWSACDPVTNKKSMIRTLKSGSSDCQPTQMIQKLCKRKKRERKKKKVPCKYKKKKWGACNSRTNTVSRMLMLRKGNIGDCQATKIMSRPCRKNKRKSERKKNGCQYDKSQWGPCDAATNTVTRTLTLKSGDPQICNATKTDVQKCKDKHLRPHVCKYKRATWSECNPVTNMKVMVKMLKRGDPVHCEATTTVERKCKKSKKGPVTSKVCKYKFEPWSDCAIATNTMTRRQILKSGPSTCQQTKEYTKRCKVSCKYKQGEWTVCDKETNQMTRTDTLSNGSADFCGKTRILSKKCNKKGKKCKYDYGVWGDCDIDTNKRTRVRTLITGDEDCQPEKSVAKTCTKSNGEARCFFGSWGDYDECQNGVQKKKRLVIQGGLECERKGVKIKSC